MKVTDIWVYPIKALRGITLQEADLGPQGIKYDRMFMLWCIKDTGEMVKMQLSAYPECSLFAQRIVGDDIHVQYMTPKGASDPVKETLQVPLNPDITQLVQEELNLHNSKVSAYRMGPKYDAWFSACFGFSAAFFYIGDQRRPVLGTFAPQTPEPQRGWMSSLSSSIMGSSSGPEPHWLTFTDMAPYLVTTEASLRNVSARLAEGDMDMYKFRPNIVVDGQDEWDEDYWEELAVNDNVTFAMTKLCNRCTSLNVDYTTGRTAEGERGTVLKKLMSDRRIDSGYKYAPCFGHYGFLAGGMEGLTLKVGDKVEVTKRMQELPVWDWPMKMNESARFYRYS